MAASGGLFLVPKALNAVRFALRTTTRLLQDKFSKATTVVRAETQPVFARNPSPLKGIDRIIALRQGRRQFSSTAQASLSLLRLFSSSTRSNVVRSALPRSRAGQAVSRLTGRAPFASCLRPNLTGGALGRSAGGYGAGSGRVGGARYFSHTPAAPAQVVNNVSQAVRAFWLSGQKAQFDGMSSKMEKQFKTVSAAQETVQQKMQSAPYAAPGSYIDFRVAPTITAIRSLQKASPCHSDCEQDSLNGPTILKRLSSDFARGSTDLAIVMNDLEKLSTLGNLALTQPNSSTIRVRFPGCDADTVHQLCEEVGVRRGLVRQDQDFDRIHGTEMALLFPFAPAQSLSTRSSDFSAITGAAEDARPEPLRWQNMLSSPSRSTAERPEASIMSDSFEEITEVENFANLPSLSGSAFSELNGSDGGDDDVATYFDTRSDNNITSSSRYEGLEGVYRFLQECDRAGH